LRRPNAPPVLYKYRSLAGEGFRRVLELFARGHLYFADLDELNDPSEGFAAFPMTPSVDPTYNREAFVESLMGAAMMRSDAKRTYGVCSLSSRPQDVVMWSHYADSHRGVCIGFSTTAEGSTFARAERVAYGKKVLLPNRFDSLEKGQILLERLKRLSCLSKARQWKYEGEWRILDTPGIHQVSPRLIVDVIVGSRMSREHRSWIRDWVQTHTPKATLRCAHIFPGSFEMELTPLGPEEPEQREADGDSDGWF